MDVNHSYYFVEFTNSPTKRGPEKVGRTMRLDPVRHYGNGRAHGNCRWPVSSFTCRIPANSHQYQPAVDAGV